MTTAAITGLWCARCYAVSHHPQDAANAYCGACHVYLPDGHFGVWALPAQCPHCAQPSANHTVKVDVGARAVSVRYVPCWHYASECLTVTRDGLPGSSA